MHHTTITARVRELLAADPTLTDSTILAGKIAADLDPDEREGVLRAAVLDGVRDALRTLLRETQTDTGTDHTATDTHRTPVRPGVRPNYGRLPLDRWAVARLLEVSPDGRTRKLLAECTKADLLGVVGQYEARAAANRVQAERYRRLAELVPEDGTVADLDPARALDAWTMDGAR